MYYVVTGTRHYSADLPRGGLVACTLKENPGK